MKLSDLTSVVAECLAQHLGSQYGRCGLSAHGAGCINDTYEAHGPGLDSVFIKTGPKPALSFYEQEIIGLETLARCHSFRIPQPYFCVEVDGTAILAMEFIELAPVRSTNGAAYGEALAQLHSIEQTQYGLDADNYIGRTPQINQWRENWGDFFAEYRLFPQIRMAQSKGVRSQLVEKLEKLASGLADYFGHYQPTASLLHGDLWTGNTAVDGEGKPCLFDPAIYFGDRETDLAMSRMFGALPDSVYQSYHACLPAREGHGVRQRVYDLYHWLNHVNLFGVTYLGQVEQAVDYVLPLMEKPC